MSFGSRSFAGNSAPILVVPAAPTGTSASGAYGDAALSEAFYGAQGPAITAVAGDGLATLKWTAPISNSPLTVYVVTPYIGGVAQTPVYVYGSPPATAATVNGLTNGTGYTFTVHAVNAVGAGPESVQSNSVTPVAAGVPGAPGGISSSRSYGGGVHAGAQAGPSVIFGDGQATITWSAPASNGAPITSYTVTPYVAGVAGTPVVVSGNPPATSATVTGLTNGVATTFVVTATNAKGTGPSSTAARQVTPTAAQLSAQPQPWRIEIWSKGATALMRTLASPTFAAPATDMLNAVGAFSFSLGLYDADAPYCNPALGREVKVYRGNVLRWAGRIWTDQVDFAGQRVTFGCLSLLDYFRDRFLDKGSARINLLSNSDFESGVAGWTPKSFSLTATSVATDHVIGSRCVQLVQTVDSADAYLSQFVTYSAGGVGAVVELTAWVKVVSWVGPALNNSGLVIRQTDGASTVYGFQSADLNYQTARGKWLKLSVSTQIPANTTRVIEARLYAPHGTVLWDASFASLYESFSQLGQDQANIAAQTVQFSQNAVYLKDALGINTATPLTGVVRDRTYQFADHISALQAVTEYPTLVDGMDFEVGPSRVFTTYLRPAGIGTDKTATVTLTFGANCQPVRRMFDGPAGASDVTTLGNGSGPGREEGGASDTTLYGGVIVQQVLPSPSPDTKVDVLNSWAARQLAIFKDPTTFDVIVTDRVVAYSLRMGDRVTLAGNLGYVQESGHAKIVALSADPMTDLVTLTLNRAP